MKNLFVINEKKRQIIKDYENESLTIKGDSAPSSIACYAVCNRFNEITYFISITYNHAKSHASFLNAHHNTDSFYVIERTLFI